MPPAQRLRSPGSASARGGARTGRVGSPSVPALPPLHTPARRPPSRLRRWLRRLLLLALLLLVLGVSAFTWLCYWPLEGGQERVTDLVPGSADFLVRTTWSELRDTGFLQANLRDEPLLPDLAHVWSRQVRPALDRLADTEARINAQIPLQLATFSVEDDLIPGEVIVAGRWCRDLPPPRPPGWRELLVLFRTGWKARAAVAALEHGFIRDATRGDGVTITPTDEPGVYKVVLAGVRVSDPRHRSGCGEGFVMPPENEWYLARVRDVIAFSNSANLIAKAVDLGRGAGASFVERPGFQVDPAPGAFTAAMDLRPLHVYLRRLLDLGGERTRVFRYVLGVDALDRMVGQLSLANPAQVSARASVRLEERGLGEEVRTNYRAPPLDAREGLAAFLPAADTYAALQLRTDPLHLLNAIHDGLLSGAERDLWRRNLLEKGTYVTVDAFLRDIAQYLGDSVAIAGGRLSELYDAARFPELDVDDRDRPPNSQGAIAFVVPLRLGARQGEVDDFLAARVHLMGFSNELERVEYRGFRYTRLKFERVQEAADLRLVRPAYLLVQDRLVFASHEAYFRRVLDTLAEPEQFPSVARDPSFQRTMAALPPQAHVSVWIDLERLTRVPPPSPDVVAEPDPPGGPRGLLWDRRKAWINDVKEWRPQAIELRRKLSQRYGGGPLTVQQDEQVEREIGLAKEAWYARYPDFLEEYRRQLLGYRRLSSVGAVMRAQGTERLEADTVLLLRPADPR